MPSPDDDNDDDCSSSTSSSWLKECTHTAAAASAALPTKGKRSQQQSVVQMSPASQTLSQLDLVDANDNLKIPKPKGGRLGALLNKPRNESPSQGEEEEDDDETAILPLDENDRFRLVSIYSSSKSMGMQIAKVYRGPFSFIQVKNIYKDSIAALHGIQMGDLLYVEQATTTTTTVDEPRMVPPDSLFTAREKRWMPATSYEQVTQLIQSSQRPIWLGVLSPPCNDTRIMGEETSGSKHTTTEDTRPIESATDDVVSHLLSQLDLTQVHIALQKKGPMPFPVPFCKKCNASTSTTTSSSSTQGGALLHHPWCPKHAQFQSSGAKERLILIMSGVQDSCPACMYEYYHGRVPISVVIQPGTHTDMASPWIHHAQCGRGNNITTTAVAATTTSTTSAITQNKTSSQSMQKKSVVATTTDTASSLCTESTERNPLTTTNNTTVISIHEGFQNDLSNSAQ
jgi:hypothetical protein